jgi:hypothetical protein
MCFDFYFCVLGNEAFFKYIFGCILSSSWLLRDVRWFETDVSGLHVGPTFNGQAVSNHLTPRNNTEYGRIQFNCGGNPRSRSVGYNCK